MTVFARPVQVVVLKRRTPIVPSALATRTFRLPMSIGEIASAIATLKERASRLRPPLNDKPHQWHEDKSELVRDISELEDAVRKGTPLPARLKQEG